MTGTDLKTISISYDNLENIVVSWLYAVGAIKENEDVVLFDLPVEVDNEGNVQMDIEVIVD